MERINGSIATGLILLLFLPGCVERIAPTVDVPLPDFEENASLFETNDTLIDNNNSLGGTAIDTAKNLWNKDSTEKSKTFFRELMDSFLGGDGFNIFVAALIIIALVFIANRVFNGAVYIVLFLLVLYIMKILFA